MDQGLKDYSLFDILEKRAINVNDCTLYRTIFNAKFKEKEIVFKSITSEKERLIKAGHVRCGDTINLNFETVAVSSVEGEEIDRNGDCFAFECVRLYLADVIAKIYFG